MKQLSRKVYQQPELKLKAMKMTLLAGTGDVHSDDFGGFEESAKENSGLNSDDDNNVDNIQWDLL